MTFDPVAFAKGVGEQVRAMVGKMVGELSDRLATVEDRLNNLPTPKDGENGKDGIDGKSIGVEDIRPLIDEAVKALPTPKDGADGKNGIDGKSIGVEEIQPLIEEAIKALPTPKDGTDGTDGTDGLDGKSVSVEEVRPLIEEAVKSLPAPKDGTDGKDGESVTVEQVLPTLQAQVQSAIDALPIPQDGKSLTLADIAPMLEEMQSRWALEFERRAQDTLQRSLDRMPKPADGKDGKDGADGFGFDDLTMEHDGEREFTFRFQRGDQVKEFKFSAPLVIDRGFWKEGMAVSKGDGVTFGGSYWVAQKDTATKPETTNPDFRLAVKKGRDGKDGDKGDQGPPGEKGLPGLNGKNL
jgi:hypothetical protein